MLLKVLLIVVSLKWACAGPVNIPPEVPVKDFPILAKTFAEILAINAENQNVIEGDIAVDQQRNAIADKNLRWDKAAIPFKISGQFSYEKKTTILTALHELEVRGCFKFVEASTESDYLSFEMASGCYSNVGRIGGKQTVSIGVGCDNHRTVIHEMLHALGFWHEQSRTDRDDYVEIVWDVISEGKEYNFNKYESDELDTQGVPYDYDSIMHYHDTAFTKNGSKTIIAPPEKTGTMGRMDALSKIDVQELNMLYECEGAAEGHLDANGFTMWTQWSPCDQSCSRTRQRFCDGDQCTNWGEVETETGSCDTACEVGRDPDCGLQLFEANSGSITSPLFPYSYKSHANCIQTISTPEGSRVRLEFQVFEIEDFQGGCYYDFLFVYDGPDDSSPKIGTFCGSSLPSSLTSTGNTLTLKFTSDYSEEMAGYYVNYFAMYGALHSCSFEDTSDFCGWTDDTTVELTFRSNKGTTASGETGPTTDHTFGDSNGRYLYLEASSPAVDGNIARIISPLFYPIAKEFCFGLWYNMYGINTESLSVRLVTDDVVGLSLVSISGSKADNQWYFTSVNLPITEPFKLAIEAVRGNGYKGDIAIDDVTLNIGKCQ